MTPAVRRPTPPPPAPVTPKPIVAAAPRPAPVVPTPAPPKPAPPPTPIVLPTGPAPAIANVWRVRGLALLFTIGIPLAWPPVLPLAFGLVALGVNVFIAIGIAYVVVLGGATLGLVLWAAAARRRMKFTFGPDALEIEKGVVFRTRTRVPHAAIHEVHVRTGPLLRGQGLATIRLRYRGGLEGVPRWGEVSLPGLREPAHVEEHLARVTRLVPAAAAPTAPTVG